MNEPLTRNAVVAPQRNRHRPLDRHGVIGLPNLETRASRSSLRWKALSRGERAPQPGAFGQRWSQACGPVVLTNPSLGAAPATRSKVSMPPVRGGEAMWEWSKSGVRRSAAGVETNNAPRARRHRSNGPGMVWTRHLCGIRIAAGRKPRYGPGPTLSPTTQAALQASPATIRHRHQAAQQCRRRLPRYLCSGHGKRRPGQQCG